jgi:hypothetical protein
VLDEREREKQLEEERKLLIDSLRAELMALAGTLCSRKIPQPAIDLDQSPPQIQSSLLQMSTTWYG